MFQGRQAEDILKIIKAGGGVILSARYQITENLIAFARASSSHKSTIILKDTDNLETDDLVNIARAGQGNVVFEIKVSEKG